MWARATQNNINMVDFILETKREIVIIVPLPEKNF